MKAVQSSPSRWILRGIATLWTLTALGLTAAAAEPQVIASDDVLGHLNASIQWYRHIQAIDRTMGEPSDSFYLENARTQAMQALQLAFQVAVAQAAVQDADQEAAEASAPDAGPMFGPEPNPASNPRTLQRAAERVAARIDRTEAEIEAIRDQLRKVPAAKRKDLELQRDQLEAELDLARAQQEAIQKINQFASQNDGSKMTLAARIDQLKSSVPEVFAPAPAPEKKAAVAKTAPASAAAAGGRGAQDNGPGLIGQAGLLFSQMKSLRDVDQLLEETQELHEHAKRLETPLMTALRATIQQGREVADAPPSTDRLQLEATRKTLEALTTKFKGLAAGTVPLRQELMLLDQTRGNLGEWRASIRKQYGAVLSALITHAGTVLLALALVAGLSTLWRRATFRLVGDPRRRRQLQLLRRFVTGFLMAVVIILGFVSEFGSLATFAGFLTAGIAVALQTVILSIAAYFFLIGRYGLRVGDRVTVSGVTGDVIDIGLVRLYLMELAGTGVDLYPTGRVVVISNSVLFQAAPFYKQIPGTEFVWREVAIALAPGADAGRVEEKLLQAVTSVYDPYQQAIERQHRAVERLIDFQLEVPRPIARLQFADGGIECLVRYPVELRRSAEVDDKMTRSVMEAIAGDPELQKVVVGTPKLRATIRA